MSNTRIPTPSSAVPSGSKESERSSARLFVPPVIAVATLLLRQCVEAQFVNQGLSYTAQSIRTFSNKDNGLTSVDISLIADYTSSAVVVLANEPITMTPFNTQVYQYEGSNSIKTGKVEMALSDIRTQGEFGTSGVAESAVISFRDDNKPIIEGQFDSSTKSLIYDPNLPATYERQDSSDHTIVFVKGRDGNDFSTFMIVVFDKLDSNADLKSVMKDPSKAKEVTIVNSVTGEKIIIPQNSEPSLPTEQGSESPSLFDQLGKLFEPATLAHALGEATATPLTPASEAIATEIPATLTATVEPAIVIPDELKGLQESLGTDFTLVEAGELDSMGNQIYAMQDKEGQTIPDVKIYKDGTSDRSTQVDGVDTKLVVPLQTISTDENGNLLWSGWKFENGAWKIITSKAPETVEDTATFATLGIIEGHAREKEMDLTIHKYVQMATAETAASEFEDIYVDGEKIKSVIPADWESYPRTLEGMKIINMEDSEGYNQLVALKQGYAKLAVYDADGKQKLDLTVIPIITRDTDGLIFSRVGLADPSFFSRMLEFGYLTREKRTGLMSVLIITATGKDSEALHISAALLQFAAEHNQELKDLLEQAMNKLPQDKLERSGFWIF